MCNMFFWQKDSALKEKKREKKKKREENEQCTEKIRLYI